MPDMNYGIPDRIEMYYRLLNKFSKFDKTSIFITKNILISKTHIENCRPFSFEHSSRRECLKLHVAVGIFKISYPELYIIAASGFGHF